MLDVSKDAVDEALSSEGPIAKALPHFSPRDSQQQMANAVQQAIRHAQVLLVEAGTGTGKTFAYLVPALLSGQRVVISTGTKTLQDQLFKRDLPLVRDALATPVKMALLKGRANYLCLHRLEQVQGAGFLHSKQAVSDLQTVREWAATTQEGDIAELGAVAESADVWPQVTSTKDNCLGQECAYFKDCHVMKARRRAQESDIVVVNHHLFFADIALRDEGVAELLPEADAVIFDEAHQLSDVAMNFFGDSISSRQLFELAQDVNIAHFKEAKDMSKLLQQTDAVQLALKNMRLAFGKMMRREAWHTVGNSLELQAAISDLKKTLSLLQGTLEVVAERGKTLEQCYRRCVELSATFNALTGSSPADQIHWFETFQRAFVIRHTPMDVSEQFQAMMQAKQAAWVLTSATLAVGQQFTHFAAPLGLNHAKELLLDSPFDFEKQALLYVPRALPDPSASDYTEALIHAALPVLEASKGRAFLLFTSHRALKLAAELLEGKTEYPLLVQGTQPRATLLTAFRAHGNAILLGTSSFWEGVDVRGEALSCVIIDKLPFASPGDPLIEARIASMKKQGKNAFMEYQLPSAVITLKQGVGRLIRDIDDRGVLMLCDPRLIARPYGKLFLNSLPSMPRTRELAKVQDFFKETATT